MIPRMFAAAFLVLAFALSIGGCGSVAGRSDGGQGGAAGTGGTAGTGGASGTGGSVGSGGGTPDAGTGGLDGGTPDAGAVDAPAADAPATDTGTPPPCNPTAPFGAARPVTGLDSASNDEGFSLSPDGLVVYFSSDRPGGAGGFDVYTATRTSPSQPFGSVTAVPGVNSPGNDREPRISRDGLTMIFASDRVAANGPDIMIATRASTLATFGTPAALANVNSTSQEYEAYVSADGKTLLFESNRPGGLGSFDLYMATLGPSGSFGAPQSLAALGSAVEDTSPVLTPDGLTIYFGSTRNAGMGYDIFVARRSTLSDGFGAPAVVTELQTTSFEWPLELSADGCTLYLGTNRPGGSGLYDIYSAQRGR